MNKIGLIGGGFQHAYSTTLWKHPKYFEWSKNKVEDITFFVDADIQTGINFKCKKKIAWLVESRIIIPDAMNYVKDNWELISKSYDLLLTHDATIYNLAENFHYLPPHGYWIKQPQLYEKTRLVSLISSTKNFSAGHTNRLNWVNYFKDKVDLYGRGFNQMDEKEEGLKDYMFSITIENDSYPTYWSEKILDCFACGTIPIYHGAPDIGDYFNMDGIIILDENFNIDQLTPELYLSKEDAIIDNFNRCLQYNVIEDLIWDRYTNIFANN